MNSSIGKFALNNSDRLMSEIHRIWNLEIRFPHKLQPWWFFFIWYNIKKKKKREEIYYLVVCNVVTKEYIKRKSIAYVTSFQGITKITRNEETLPTFRLPLVLYKMIIHSDRFSVWANPATWAIHILGFCISGKIITVSWNSLDVVMSS